MIIVMMDIGYSEREVGHMYFGKWEDLYYEWKKLHNMRMERMVFKGTEEVHSLMDM